MSLARLEKLVTTHTGLEQAHAYNTDVRAAILAADVDSTGEPSYLDRILNGQTAEWYAVHADRFFGVPLNQVDVVTEAGITHFNNAVRDRRVGSIVLIGHAAYDLWHTADGPVTWMTAGEMVEDHLKSGVVANLGCGLYDPRATLNIPVGNFVVGGEGKLLGKAGEEADTYRSGSIDYYQELPRVGAAAFAVLGISVPS